jgi:hypothetical protein
MIWIRFLGRRERPINDGEWPAGLDLTAGKTPQEQKVTTFVFSPP